MSFRTRLTLFFVLIVVIPMIALGVVVARLVSGSEQGKVRVRVDAYAAVALGVYRRDVQTAALQARALAADARLADALRRGDARAARMRVAVLARSRRLARVLVLRPDGRTLVALGDAGALAGATAELRFRGASSSAAAHPAPGPARALVGVSTTTARAYLAAAAPPGTHVAVFRGSAHLAATLSRLPARPLPTSGTVTIAHARYAAAGFTAADLGGARDTITVLTPAAPAPSLIGHGRSRVLLLLVAFLLLALAGALFVSRQLQAQLTRLLEALRRIGEGDTTRAATVAKGGDELAEIGREFVHLSGQLEHVKRQAVTDELTGLFNHRRFQEVIATEVAAAARFGQPVGLLMLDIDDFKQVNDAYGHQQGDVVLRAVARVLREQSREIDEPARYGGEEMAVALPHTDLDGAYVIAERVRTAVEQLAIPCLADERLLHVTVSCGVAAGIDIAKDALVAEADAALYRAKRAGKNRTMRAPARTGGPIPVGDAPR